MADSTDGVVREELATCIYEKEGHVARVILNRPERANAQNSQLVHDFDDLLTKAENDFDVKVVIIKANGRGFCSGHDLGGGADSYPEFMESLEAFGSPYKGTQDLFLWPVLRLWEFRKPTIAQVHGYAIGGGTYFAWLPDIVIASDDAYFQMPLIHGLNLPGGETMIEPWVFMNYHRAARYLYTGQTLTAADALEMGLVNEVVPRDDLEATVEKIASDIAAAPLSTLILAKSGLRRAGDGMGMRTHIQWGHDIHLLAGSFNDKTIGPGANDDPDAPFERPRQRVARVTGTQ
jgi:enoyl-CoA hydratase